MVCSCFEGCFAGMAAWKPSPTSLQAAAQRYDVDVIETGFVEKTFRLLFRFQQDYATAPKLLTIMNYGGVQTEEICKPANDGACIAYTYAQSPLFDGMKDAIKAKESSGENWPTERYSDLVEPFIFPRKDGSTALVQTWPTAFNDMWRERFAERYLYTDGNPYPDVIEDTAAEDFAVAMERLWGDRACVSIANVSNRTKEHIEYCVASAENNFTACVGSGCSIIEFLKANEDARALFNIVDPQVSAKAESTDYSFVSKCTYPFEPSKDAENQTKLFYVDPDVRYVLYIKDGWEKMASVKPEDQFLREAEWKQTDDTAAGDDVGVSDIATGLLLDQALDDDDDDF